MRKVLGIHELELNDGVQADEFEKVLDEVAHLPLLPGMRISYLKGVRGTRNGKYLIIYEHESVERWSQLWPPPDKISQEIQDWFAVHGSVMSQLDTLSTNTWTDYAELGP